MKRAALWLFTVLVAVSISSFASSGERKFYGTAVGIQSTRAVSAIAGTVGFSVGHFERRSPVPPFYINPPGFRQKYNRHHRNYRPHNRHYDDRYCRIMEERIYKYGKRYIIRKRVCLDDGKYRRDYFDWRGYRGQGRYDRYRDRDRDRHDGYRERYEQKKQRDRFLERDRHFKR